jgi:DNA-binding CsgD family transcriptional regulator
VTAVLHAALEIAAPAGLRLRAIDHLHLLAVLSHQRRQPMTAARIGYVVRELPDRDAVDLIEAELHGAESEAWGEGVGLAFSDAIEYARRSRGQRSRPTVGWASLTPTERRVAALVAEGRSNDDVAREALMSVATVKTHLTHIFAKTGVSTRAELAAKFPRT